MGCCYSKRSDLSEKNKGYTSTKSLRLEIDKKALNSENPEERNKKKRLPRLSSQDTGDLSSGSSSSKTLSRPSFLKTVSIKGSRPTPSNSQHSIDLSELILKTPVEENFTTIRKLHLGFYGDILLVNDKRTSIKRAIKEIKKSAIQKNSQKQLIIKIQRFLSLDHPNIVKLHEVYESGEKWSLVYEYLLGNNLLDKINNGSIGSKLASAIIRDILSSLNYCHRNRTCHLGLNLEKIILDSSEGKNNCKITGFTFPWELEDQIKINEVTCFMAPEILYGIYNKFASDIWSAGVILYSMIQGKLPFHGKSREALLNDYKRGIIYEESDWLLDSSELKDLLIKMLEFDYDKRISIKEALNHPWVKNNQSLLSNSANNEAINRLVEFTSKDKFAKAFFSFFKVNLAEQNDNREFIDIFKSLDTNKDGQITKRELINETQNLDIKVQNKLKKILKSADLMKKGYIEFSEFATACTDWNTDENIKKFEKAFKLWNKSGDGQLSLKELKASIKGIRASEWAEFFENIHVDPSGTISFEKLKNFLFGDNYTTKNQA